MANRDLPRGFVPVGSIDGVPRHKMIMKCFVASGDSAALGIGDPVKRAGSADTSGVHMSVTRAAGSEGTPGKIFGVVVGTSEGTVFDPIYRTASVANYVLVCPVHGVIFRAQEDSDGGNLAATSVGSNIDMIGGAPNTTTGLSIFELDSSSASDSGAAQWSIIGLAPEPGNDIGTNADWLVVCNEPDIYANSNGV